MGWCRIRHRKRFGARRHNWTRVWYSHHRAEERDRSDVAGESRNSQTRSTAMAWGRFFGRWNQFRLNHEHSRLAQLAWMEALGLYWRHRTKLAALRRTRVSWPTF